MSLVSKTVLQQMRFVSRGQPFCSIAAKTSITDTSDFYRQGQPFFGVETEITPPVYTYTPSPVRQGNAFKWVNAKSTIDSNYGKVLSGQPFYVQSSTHTYPVYALSPVRRGDAFKWITGNSSIDASSDYYQKGQPFYVYYGGTPPPVTFDATRMFLIF
jgi:hypothetical protein